MTTHLLNVSAAQWMGTVTPRVEWLRLKARASWIYPDKPGPLTVRPGVIADVASYLITQDGSDVEVMTPAQYRATFGDDLP